MKRRDFIILSFYSGVLISLPFSGCGTASAVANRAWIPPGLLSNICDAKTLKEIGTNYRQKFSDENNEERLANLLLTDNDSKVVPGNSDDAVIHSLLEKKIKKDFETGDTVVIKGWILSKTEAQQCALFSFTQN
jgi:hypothetical protein